MRVLFISQYYSPEVGGGPTRVTGLAENLVKLGHAVTVITGFPNYPSGVISPEYRGRFFLEESINGVRVLRTWLFTSQKKTKARRLLTYLTFAFSATLRALLVRGDSDVIFASSPPLFVGIPALVLSKVKNIPYVFDVRDLWPEIAVHLGQLSGDSIAARVAERLEMLLYSSARQVSVVTRGKREKLLRRGVPSNKVFVLSNGVDDDFLTLPDGLIKRADLGFADQDFIVTYAGTVGLAQGIEILVDAATRLRNNPRIKFLIIGEGVEKPVLMDRVNAARLDTVRFLPLQPKYKMPSLLRISDIAFVPLKSHVLTDSVPSKLYEYLGVGCPVILAARGDSGELVREAEAGIIVEPGNVEHLVETLTYLFEHREILAQYGENGRAYVRENCLRSSIAITLEKQLLELVSC